MFLDIQIYPDSDKCPNCLTWGRTVTRDDAFKAAAHGMKKMVTVRCERCGRLTFPNQGVNCPAGSSVGYGGGNAMSLAEEVMKETIGIETDLKYGIDILPQPIALTGKVIRPNPKRPPEYWSHRMG